jgi:hypothetical protein
LKIDENLFGLAPQHRWPHPDRTEGKGVAMDIFELRMPELTWRYFIKVASAAMALLGLSQPLITRRAEFHGLCPWVSTSQGGQSSGRICG